MKIEKEIAARWFSSNSDTNALETHRTMTKPSVYIGSSREFSNSLI
jgi:hypothetical protein